MRPLNAGSAAIDAPSNALPWSSHDLRTVTRSFDYRAADAGATAEASTENVRAAAGARDDAGGGEDRVRGLAHPGHARSRRLLAGRHRRPHGAEHAQGAE